MENATKALLIAAAVLIAIVLIALGVNLLNATSDPAKKAGEVSTGIKNAIDGQAGQIGTVIEGWKTQGTQGDTQEDTQEET